MLSAAEDAPDKTPQLRKFMNSYLPTSLKLLSILRTVRQRGISADEVAHAHTSALSGLDMMLSACQEQLDNLRRKEK